MKRPILISIALLLVGGAALAWWAWYSRAGGTDAQYRLGDVRRTDVVASISATGTIVPEDTIDVGAQVNGQIASFGADADGKPLDYRSNVAEGAVLATIDDALYAADAASAQAQLAQANAQLNLAQANRDQAVAKLAQAERDWQRAQKLGQTQALAQADYDAAKSTYEQSVAAVAVADAQIGQARAAIGIAEAAVVRTKRNLAYCVIRSPVSGVIIDKRVDVGQTVVASLNAPSLFLIAKDLRKMLVLVQVNEADIGSVKPGTKVRFTVDADAGRTHAGEVRKVRLNASMTQNVVTYTVEIVTDNSELRLLPYLTANVRFVTESRSDALTVPNAALRFTPRQAVASSGSATTRQPGRSTNEPRAGAGGAAAAAGGGGDRAPGRRKGDAESVSGTVWILGPGGEPSPIHVRVGITDGSVTEVQSDDLKDGMQVILGEQAAAGRGGADTTNPFAPMRRR